MFRIQLYCFGKHRCRTCLAGDFQSKTAVCGSSKCSLMEEEQDRVREKDDERDVNHRDDVGGTRRIRTKQECIKATRSEAK